MAPSGPPPRASTCASLPISNVGCCFLFVGPADLTPPLSPPRAQVSPEEVQKIVAGMEEPSGLQAGGVFVGGEKYMFIQSDDRMVAGKKVRFGARDRVHARGTRTSRDPALRDAMAALATPRASRSPSPRPAPTSSPAPAPRPRGPPRGGARAGPVASLSSSPRSSASLPSLLDVKSPVARFASLAGEQRPVREQGDDVRRHRHPRREHPGRELQHLRREPRRLPHEQRHVNRATRDFRSPRRRAPFGEVSGWRDDEGSAWGRWANDFHGRLG